MNEAFDRALAAHERLVAAKAAHNDADGKAWAAYNEFNDALVTRYVEACRPLVTDIQLLVELSERLNHGPIPHLWLGVLRAIGRHDGRVE